MAERKRQNAHKKKGRVRSKSVAEPERATEVRIGRSSHGLAALALLGIVGLAYLNALDAGFVYDDHGSIVENHHVQWESLSLDGLRDAWLRSPTRRWVANWSFGLNYWLVGLDARAFHAVNVAIHALAVLGLYVLMVQLGRRAKPAMGGRAVVALAWVAAAVFAVHPIQTQAVTYVVQRMASLSGLFCIGSLLCYVRARSSEAGSPRLWFAGAAASWLFAVGSKESAAAFPAVIWGYEWLFVSNSNRRVLARMATGVGLAGLAGLGLMQFNYLDPFRDYMYHDFSIGERLLSQGRVFWEYTGLVLWPLPSRLVLMHEFAPSRGLFSPATTVLGWVALLGVAGFGVASAVRRPWVAFGILWIGAALLVESSVFPLRLVHEHRLYLPMAGVAILLGAALTPLARRAPVALVLASLPVIALLGAATHARNEIWRSPETLWSDVVLKNPGHAGAHQNLGSAYLSDDRLEDALAEFERGRDADPAFGGNYRGLGVIHARRGEDERAIELYQQAATLDPLDHFAFAQWGATLHGVGRSEDAIAPLREALRIFEHPKSLNHLGRALAAVGRSEEAIAHHRRAIELDPAYGHARVALAHSLAVTGRATQARRALEAAIGTEAEAAARRELASFDWAAGDAANAQTQLRRALQLAPDDQAAANNLAWMLASVETPKAADLEEAASWVERVEAARGAAGSEVDSGLLDTKAVVLAARGLFAEALDVAQGAEHLARSAGDTGLAAELAKRIALYREGKRFVDPASVRR